MRFFLCPGCDAGSGLEVRRPEYGIFHPAGVAERHELTAVCHFIPLLSLYAVLFCFGFFFTLLYLPQHAWCLQTISIYLNAFSALVRCDSTERLRNSLDYLRSVLNDSTSFKLIYRYAFDFARVSQAKLFLPWQIVPLLRMATVILNFFSNCRIKPWEKTQTLGQISTSIEDTNKKMYTLEMRYE